MDKDKKKIIAGASILGAGLIAYFATRKAKGKPPVLEITLSNLAITPTTAPPGEAVTISVLTTNHSSSALATTINLTGDFTDSADITLDAGTSQIVSFTVTPTVEKTYNVSVDGLSGSFVCTSAPHGDIVLSNLVISPASCVEGDTVTISATATNQGNANEVMAVTLNLTGSKYNDTHQEIHQIILEPGASQIVTFTFRPTVAETYAVIIDSLSGSLVVNPAPTWPGWTAGTVVYELTTSPTILYLGQAVDIGVYIMGPWPATYPMNIEATINVDGATLSKVLSIDFRNPTLRFTYTPTHVGEYTVTAQDKTATFTVLANPKGTYYSPLGGTRMPLCTDIVLPNVEPFQVKLQNTIIYDFPGGDLKYSEFFGSMSSVPISQPISHFIWSLWYNVPQITARIPYAEPCAWNPSSATITSWIKSVTTSSVLLMATEYTCQEFWGSKDELSKMIASFIGPSMLNVPDDWKIQYGSICPECGGTGKMVTGSHIITCRTCSGTGRVLLINLGCGIRDWDVAKTQNLYVVQYYSYTYTCQIKCPYCNKYLETGAYSDSPGYSSRLDAARALIEHIETVHPDHPLTEPAWF